jgi:hypothetical protein
LYLTHKSMQSEAFDSGQAENQSFSSWLFSTGLENSWVVHLGCVASRSWAKVLVLSELWLMVSVEEVVALKLASCSKTVLPHLLLLHRTSPDPKTEGRRE